MLTDWNEKRVVLDLIEGDDSSDDVSSSTSTLHLHNAVDGRSSSNTNMMHNVPGGSGYV